MANDFKRTSCDPPPIMPNVILTFSRSTVMDGDTVRSLLRQMVGTLFHPLPFHAVVRKSIARVILKFSNSNFSFLKLKR